MQDAGKEPGPCASGRLGDVQARLQRVNLGILQPQQLLQLPRLGLQYLSARNRRCCLARKRLHVGVVPARADLRMD